MLKTGDFRQGADEVTERSETLSPLDGRYARHIEPLKLYFSEHALCAARLWVEAQWLLFLADLEPVGVDLSPQLRNFLSEWSLADARATVPHVFAHESVTNHDVKAVEYALADLIRKIDPKSFQANQLGRWIHFGCTSEDINNASYAVLLQSAYKQEMRPALLDVLQQLRDLAAEHSATAMLARTHGQPASPTTFGKEIVNIAIRLSRLIHVFDSIEYKSKWNGAVGNYNAHRVAFPELDWPACAESFVTERLCVSFQDFSTQIEPHDWIADFCVTMNHISRLLTGFCQDVWTYNMLGYLTLKKKEGEVGSSTMPHKVNPIDFENAEGNFGISVSLASHFAEKLVVSRLQRDLSDSTVLRNFGVAVGHFMLSLKSLQRGMGKLAINTKALAHDLDGHWEVLGEAIQTVLRKQGHPAGYEKLKEMSRGLSWSRQDYMSALRLLKGDLGSDYERLLELTPSSYTGAAKSLVERGVAIINELCGGGSQ